MTPQEELELRGRYGGRVVDAYLLLRDAARLRPDPYRDGILVSYAALALRGEDA